MRNAYKILIGISKGRHRHRQRITLILILKKLDMRSVFWILPAQTVKFRKMQEFLSREFRGTSRRTISESVMYISSYVTYRLRICVRRQLAANDLRGLLTVKRKRTGNEAVIATLKPETIKVHDLSCSLIRCSDYWNHWSLYLVMIGKCPRARAKFIAVASGQRDSVAASCNPTSRLQLRSFCLQACPNWKASVFNLHSYNLVLISVYNATIIYT